jgi:hypothetical protein
MAVDLDLLRKQFRQHKQEEEQKQKSRTKFETKWERLELHEGDNFVRIGPPVEEEVIPYKEGNFHFRLGPSKKRKVSCAGEKCRACEEVRDLYNSGSKEDVERARDIRKSTRYLFNGIKHDKEGNIIKNDGSVVKDFSEFKPYLFETGKRLWEEILGIICEYGDITDLNGEDGRVLKITRHGEGRFTNYTVLPAKEPSTLPKPQKAWFLKNLHDFSEDVAPGNNDKIIEIMEGGVSHEEDEEDDENAGTPPCFSEYEDDEDACQRCTVAASCKLEAETS